MNFTSDNYLLIASLLLLISIFASKASYKIGAPLLLLFLGVGLFAGQHIVFNDGRVAAILGELALVFILFSGGLETRYRDIRPVVFPSLLLSTLGVFFTAVVLGLFVYGISNLSFVPVKFSLAESFLLGAIVSSTDAASVFSIFRSKNTGLKENLRPLLELESGSNDPMAYVLTLAFVSYVALEGSETSAKSLWWLGPEIVKSLVMGGGFGFVFGKIFVRIINRINLFVEGLYPVMLVALMALAFSATKTLGGNGFMAVYVAGMILGNAKFIHKKMTLKFYEGIAWMMQILLFLTLGLFANIYSIRDIVLIGIPISLFLMFVARPLAVWFCLFPFRLSKKAFVFVSWVGLRGAVPIVFALIPLSVLGNDNVAAHNIFNVVFFISVFSLLLQGMTFFPIAKMLKLTSVETSEGGESAFNPDVEDINTFNAEITLHEACRAAGKSLAELDFPTGTLIVMLRRGNEFLTPKGNTILQIGDILQIQADSVEELSTVRKKLS